MIQTGGLLIAIAGGAIIAFLFVYGSNRTGCSVYFILPITLFALIILLSGILRVDALYTLSTVTMIAGIILVMDWRPYSALTGLLILGVAFSISPILTEIAVGVFLFIVCYRLFTIPGFSRLLLVSVLVLSVLIMIVSKGPIGGLMRSLESEEHFEGTKSSQNQNPLEYVQDGQTATDAQSMERNPLRSSGMVNEAQPETGIVDSIIISLFYTLSFVLVASIAWKMFRITRGFARLIPPLLILISLLIFIIGGFMYLRSLPLAENVEFSLDGGVQSQTPSSNVIEVEDSPSGDIISEESALSGILFETLRWSSLVALAILSIALALAIVFVTTNGVERRRRGSNIENSIKEPRGSRKPLDREVPPLKYNRKFILDGYRWMRMSFFKNYVQLTPNELMVEIDQEKRGVLSEVTSIYVPVKYGQVDPSREECLKFHSLLLELSQRRETGNLFDKE